ncbi:DUF523 domain-containing protein [Candidatus Parcubacteria bacterium]|nr:DUF523 domain-containing protein [Candidatus Parcubacteria bacterium]
MKLISACLVGINCKYNGKNNLADLDPEILKEYKQGKLIPVCPEQLGGLSTPRILSQIQNASGEDVLDGRAKILTEKGINVTEQFVRGAEEVLKIAKALNIKEAIFKQRSPSCGCGQIYDGTFTKTVKRGDGITTALLKRNGISVATEED